MNLNSILDLFGHPYFLTWVGSICAHILSLYRKDFKGTTTFFEKIIPNKSSTFYFRLDFIVLPFIGTILAIALLEPVNVKTAIFSGLSWSGAILALLKSDN